MTSHATDTAPLASAARTAPLAPAITDAAELLALFREPADAGRRASAHRTRGFANDIWVRPAPPRTLESRAVILRGPLAFDASDPTHPPGPEVPVPPDMPPGPGPDGPADPTDPTLPHPGGPEPAALLASDPTHPPGPEVPVPPDMPPGPGPDGPVDPTDPAAPHPGAPGWPEPTALQPGDRLLLRVAPDELPAYCAWLVAAAPRLPPHTSLAPWCPTPGGLLRLHLIAAARLALPLTTRVEVRHDLIGIRLAQVALGFGADTLAGPQDNSRHLPLAAVPRPSETSQAALCELVRQAGLDAVTQEPPR